MSIETVPQPGFFVTGGTIPPGAGSYVERGADAELFAALSAKEYCYVLNARQMGKSSLAVHTIDRLRKAGIRCAFIDLTRIGGASVSLEQWFAGLVVETGRALGLRSEAASFFAKNTSLGPSQRFLAFLQEVALPAAESPLIVFLDEVDAARGLSFNADELFSGIRQLHNGRASNLELANLTFCLLGAALPSDLIRDPRITPFNVGRRIELRDFTLEESQPFAGALGPEGKSLLARVHYWTGGHPYLTQSLCAELAASSEENVDALVRTRYLADRARDTDSNLADIGNRLLARGDSAVGQRERADTLSAYEKVLRGGAVADDESNLAAARIKMSGVARVENGMLRPRNQIYRQAFNRKWIHDNMPGEELRRQRLAFMKGVIRTATVSGVVIAIVTALALIALHNANLATRLEIRAQIDRDIARYGEYVSTMRNMNELRSQHNLMLISKALDSHRRNPWRGWEWNFWHYLSHRELRNIDTGNYGSGFFGVSPDGRFGIAADGFGIGVFDIASGKRVSESRIGSASIQWLHDSRRFFACGSDGKIRLFDATTGKILVEKPATQFRIGSEVKVLPGDAVALSVSRTGPIRMALPSLEIKPFPHEPGLLLGGNHEDVTKDGKLVAWHVVTGDGHRLTIRRANSGQTVRDIDVGEKFAAFCFSPDSQFLAIGTMVGNIRVFSTAKGQAICSYSAFKGPVDALHFSQDGKRLAASAIDRQGALVQFDGRSLQEERRFAECGTMEFIPGSNTIAVPYWSTRIYSLDAEPDVPELKVGGDYTNNAMFLANGDLLVSNGSRYRRVSITPSGLKAHPTSETEFGLDGEYILRAALGHVSILDRTSRKTLIEVDSKDGTQVEASPTGAMFTYRDGELKIHLPNVSPTAIALKIPAPPSSLSFSANNRLFAMSCLDGSISLYQSDNGHRLWKTFDSKRCAIRGFAFSPDGTRLGAASDSDNADIYDLRNGRLLLSLVGHSQSAACIAWSPDGSRIATGSYDASIRLWDAKTGADFGIIGSNDLSVLALRFIDGGHSLASYGLNGSVKLWKTQD